MNRKLYLMMICASIIFAGIGNAQVMYSPNSEFGNNVNHHQIDFSKMVNGSSTIGDVWAYGMLSHAYGNFPVQGPYNLNQINTIPYIITASDFDGNGTIYGVDFLTYELIEIDPYTGNSSVAAVVSGYVPGHTIDGLAWNYINSTMYAISGNGSSCTLYSIDLSTGVMTPIGETDTALGVWIVIDNNGVAYIADASTDELYTINLNNAQETLIGPLGINIEYSQEADIDTATNNLIMPGYLGNGVANVYLVDVTTGNTSLLGPLGNGYELGIFAIEGPPIIVENFECENAIPIVLGITSSNDPANTEGGASNVCFSGASNAEWYSFTPANNGALTISSDLPFNNGLNTRLSVYNDDCNNLMCIVSDDNSGSGNLSKVTFPVVAGTTYLIEWDDAFNVSPYKFELSFLIECLYPENFTVSNITETSAIFNWDMVQHATNGYILSIFHQGDDPMVDPPVYNQALPQNVTFASVSGLLPATSYDAYISSDCNTNFSEMDMINFTTLILSVEDHTVNVTMYPNPVRNILTIEIDNQYEIESIEIIDTVGKLVVSKSKHYNTIDVSHLINGLYFLRIDTEHGAIIKKLIKK